MRHKKSESHELYISFHPLLSPPPFRRRRLRAIAAHVRQRGAGGPYYAARFRLGSLIGEGSYYLTCSLMHVGTA